MIINVKVQDKKFDFDVELTVYNQYINEMMPNNKVTPAHNFLMRSIIPEHKDELAEMLKIPSASLQIAAAVVEEYTPDLEITVGK
ncbi:putative phage tail assembly chaperone [Maridesulfovibrio zosterae]|uniref:putative phage tail assembly chaperone n=1 Tax=Maridesulfovibrio zosterae TaxID=82171 RepID=UPI000422F401|nr:putative phage tail assembly chaperone [Maridesulfovibrio zosterae]